MFISVSKIPFSVTHVEVTVGVLSGNGVSSFREGEVNGDDANDEHQYAPRKIGKNLDTPSMREKRSHLFAREHFGSSHHSFLGTSFERSTFDACSLVKGKKKKTEAEYDRIGRFLCPNGSKYCVMHIFVALPAFQLHLSRG